MLGQILREVAGEEADQRAREEEKKKRQEIEHELVKLAEEELQK